MTDHAIQPAGSDSSRFWSALRGFPTWARSNLPALVLSAVVAGVTAYVVNVWIMAVRYDGYVVPSGSGTTGEGNLLQGGLFWALLPMLLMSIVGYRRAVGGQRFWREVRGLPLALVALVRADGEQARINLLWGAAAGMTAALVIGPSLGLVMGAGIMVAAPTVVGNVMSSTAYKALNGVLGKVSPSSSLSPDTGMLSTAVGLLGGGASLAVGFVVPDTTLKLVAALALAALAFALSNRRPAPPAAALILVAFAAAVWSLDELLRASVAIADDGGYIECGESWRDWWSQCEGADSVRTYAGFGAVAAGAGGGTGSFLGSVVGQATTNGDLGGGDSALGNYVDDLMSGPEFDDFRDQYPDVADTPEGFETYVGWRDQQGLEVPPLPDGWEWDNETTDATGTPPSDGDVPLPPPADDGDAAPGDDADGPASDDADADIPVPSDGVPTSDDRDGPGSDTGNDASGDADGPASDGSDDAVAPGSDGADGPGSDGADGADGPGSDGADDADGPASDGADDADAPGSDDPDGPGSDGADGADGPGSDGADDADGPASDGSDDADGPGSDGADGPGSDGADGPGSDGADDADGPASDGSDDADGPASDDADAPGPNDADAPTPDDADAPGSDDADAPTPDDADEPGSDDDDSATPDDGEVSPTDEGETASTNNTSDGSTDGEDAGGEDAGGEDAEELERIRVPRGENDPERTEDGETARTGDGDDGHRVAPERVAEGPDGRPLVDPETNEPLRVDEDGNVRYGDEWMSADEAAQRAAGDEAWVAEKAAGVDKVDKLQGMVDELSRTDDPAARQALEQSIRQQVIDINQDYQAKAELKAQGRTPLTEAFDERLQVENGRVDDKFIDKLSELGVKRGGQDMSTEHITDIRNATSAGTAPMDRDLALRQQRVEELLDRLEQVEPGSADAQRIAGEVESARTAIDYDKVLADKQAALADAEPGSRQSAQIASDIERIESDAGRIKSAYTSDLQRQLDAAQPGSAEAQRIETELAAAEGRVAGRAQTTFGEAVAADRITIDYDKAHAALTRQLGEAPEGSQEAHRIEEALTKIEDHAGAVKSGYVDQLERQLAAEPSGSPEAQRIQAELDAAAGRMAGRSDVEISPQRWNDIAQPAYDGAYRDVTGGDSARALQGVTQSGNPEAYRDLEVLANDPANRPFAAESGAQTSDVTGYKATENERMASEGTLSEASASQETTRGLSKDLTSKLIPELRNDPNVDPAKLDRFERMNEVLARAGRGEIPPGKVDAELRAAVPEIPGLTVDRVTELAVSNLDAATRWQPTAAERAELAERVGGPERADAPDGARGTRTMGVLSDIATTQRYTEQNIARGMDPVEAAVVAHLQTQAGNAAMASGVVNPVTGLVGQALLPNELRGALPDQAIENYVGTGYEAGSAAIDSVSESLRTGQIDTTAIDKFATSVADREGTDFFAGYARAAQLAGDESARTDGGNIVSDLKQIYETGAGREVIEQGIENFEASVARGEHGAPLEGWSHIARTVAEWTSDPGYEAESLINDLKNMWEHGVGDDYWAEANETMTDAIKRTPLLGTIAQGYEEIATGIGESGVTGFASDMAEGATALAGEAAEAAANSASAAAAWVRSWF